MAALMAAPATAALADMHSEPTTKALGLGQLVLILVLDPLLQDLPHRNRTDPSTAHRVPHQLPPVAHGGHGARAPRQRDNPDVADSPKELSRARTAPPDAWPLAAPPPTRARASQPVLATARCPPTTARPRPTTPHSRPQAPRTKPPGTRKLVHWLGREYLHL